MRTTRARLCSVAALVVASLVSTPALADDKSDKDDKDAETLFAIGRKMRLDGDCAGAIVRFRQALEAYPEGLGSLRNIAECQTSLGLYASARRSWWELRRRALKLGSVPKYKDWDTHAERAHAALDKVVPRLTIKLSGGTLEGVRVVLDREDLPKRLWGVPVERDVGEHRVEVWYGEREPFRRVVDLTKGSRETITFALPRGTRGTGATRTTTTTTSGDDGSTMRTAGFVALGIGGLGAIGFGVALGVREKALDDLEAVCRDYAHCTEEAREPHDRGRTASMLVNVFGAIGGAGIAGGVVLIAIGATRNSESASLHLAPTVGGVNARATVRF